MQTDAAVLPLGIHQPTRPSIKMVVRIRHISWRDGRPRFNPGPEARRLGWRGIDLKDASGAWLDLAATQRWAQLRQAEIVASAGARAPRHLAPASFSVGDMWEGFRRDLRMRRPDQQGALRAATVRDYTSKAHALQAFDPAFWKSPAAAISRAGALALHRRLWEAKGLHMANGTLAVLRLLFAWSRDRGRCQINPCDRLRLPSPKPRVRVATHAEIAALIEAADAPGGDPALGDAILLALWTGQRQGDVLSLEERRIDTGRLHFSQSKTGARVAMRALPGLLARLALARARKAAHGLHGAPTVVVDPHTGRAFGSDTFRHRFAALRAGAARNCPTLSSLRFQDLRDTAVTWLSLAGCTNIEIASITGHSLKTVDSTLRHYLEIGDGHADAAIKKLELWLGSNGYQPVS